ncbi:hypothetical protein L3X39_02850 [Sabulilitoribacter multivorans]|uniref:Lipoprotein n=1 Tax=Flaviramulus multivorans TaxID=1304750 RepID=A0ABS9IFK9_9FLAO|nr:hypothetical protein [Flaviramulus multivorans]MCF7559561.1 hypothetical protein [Flaviramulus multivorans]
MKNTILTLCAVLVLTCCSSKNDKLSVESIAKNTCECFSNQNSESIDEKMKPCLSDLINQNQHEIHKAFYSNKSLEDAVSKHMMDAMIYMVHNCDQYYHELDMMFTNIYPETSFENVEEDINLLTDSITGIAEIDSIKLGLIHQKISLLTKSRKLDDALDEIDYLSKNYSPSETYFIKMYIYRLQEKYHESLNEIDKAVNEGNVEYVFYAELIKRKKNDT